MLPNNTTYMFLMFREKIWFSSTTLVFSWKRLTLIVKTIHGSNSWQVFSLLKIPSLASQDFYVRLEEISKKNHRFLDKTPWENTACIWRIYRNSAYLCVNISIANRTILVMKSRINNLSSEFYRIFVVQGNPLQQRLCTRIYANTWQFRRTTCWSGQRIGFFVGNAYHDAEKHDWKWEKSSASRNSRRIHPTETPQKKTPSSQKRGRFSKNNLHRAAKTLELVHLSGVISNLRFSLCMFFRK